MQPEIFLDEFMSVFIPWDWCDSSDPSGSRYSDSVSAIPE